MSQRIVVWMIVVGWSQLFSSGSFAAAPEKAGEWTPLVRGDSLDGWYILIAGQAKKNVDPDRIFSVQDGVVHAFQDTPGGKKMPFGGMITEKEYSRFHLRLEYKWGTKKFAPRQNALRDAGILYHVTPPDCIWPQGVECQIQEGDTGDVFAVRSAITASIDPKTKDAVDPVLKILSPCFLEAAEGGVPFSQSAQGSPYEIVRVRRSHNWEHDGWNTVDVIVDGDRAVHLVNGKVNNRCTNLRHPDPNDSQRMIPLTQGKILLQAEGAEVLYRNIAIKDLSESEQSILTASNVMPRPVVAARGATTGRGFVFDALYPKP
jgi:hypothetical protein